MVDVTPYLWLARHLARQAIRGHWRDFDDAYAEACLALVRAAHGYDPERGTAFKSYASTMIVYHLQEYQRTRMRAEGWRRTSAPEGWRRIATAVPLEEARSCSTADEPAWIAARLRAELLAMAPCALTVREQQTVRARLDGATHATIARQFGVTQCRISQLERAAVRKLRQQMETRP